MDLIAENLSLEKVEDWNRVSNLDIVRYGGSSILHNIFRGMFEP
jgi:hypothetical protein